MRVHFRGIALGVTVLLGLVVAFSVFNALEDSPEDSKATRSSASLENSEQTEEEGQSLSRSFPRSSTRLRPQRGMARNGPGGALAGGGGARPGGPGARAGRPMGPRVQAARLGGVGGGRGGAGGMGGVEEEEEEDNDEEMEIDETPSEDVVEVVEERPRPARPPLRNRPASMAARAMSPSLDDEDSPGANPSFRNRPGSLAARARSQERNDEPVSSSGRKDKESPMEEEKTEKTTEEPTEPPKKEPPFPEWWKQAYGRSAVSSLTGQFVGDQPLFPQCPIFDFGPDNAKTKLFGYVEPQRYIKNSRNPCWFEWNGKKDLVKCVPYFYVAGAAKAGTADLLRRVQGHPNVVRGGEVAFHWWDRQRYGAPKTPKYTKEAKRLITPVQFKEYSKNVVGPQGKNLTKEILYQGESVTIFGDATPTYLTENTQWDILEGNQGCSEPRVIPATFIRHVFPQARVILLLRDPVDRLYSRFLDNVPYVREFENHTSALFNHFVSRAVQSYRECLLRMSVRHCAYNSSLYASSVVRLSEGMYSVFVEDWLRVFPREQVLILKFDDYVEDVHGHLTTVFTHLGVDPIDDVNVWKLSELPVLSKGSRAKDKAGPMLPETQALLSEFYDPFNLRLAQLLDDDKWRFQRSGEATVPQTSGMTVPALPAVPSDVVKMSVPEENEANKAPASVVVKEETEKEAEVASAPDGAPKEQSDSSAKEGDKEEERGGEEGEKKQEGGLEAQENKQGEDAESFQD